jgi:hypothetical protein
VERFADFVFLAVSVIYHALGLVIDGVRADHVFGTTRTFGNFLFGQSWLVKEVKLLGLNGGSQDI